MLSNAYNQHVESRKDTLYNLEILPSLNYNLQLLNHLFLTPNYETHSPPLSLISQVTFSSLKHDFNYIVTLPNSRLPVIFSISQPASYPGRYSLLPWIILWLQGQSFGLARVGESKKRNGHGRQKRDIGPWLSWISCASCPPCGI